MTEDTPQDPPALDHDDAPNEQVGELTTGDIDLTDLLGDDDPGEDIEDQAETDAILADPDALAAIAEAEEETEDA